MVLGSSWGSRRKAAFRIGARQVIQASSPCLPVVQVLEGLDLPGVPWESSAEPMHPPSTAGAEFSTPRLMASLKGKANSHEKHSTIES